MVILFLIPMVLCIGVSSRVYNSTTAVAHAVQTHSAHTTITHIPYLDVISIHASVGPYTEPGLHIIATVIFSFNLLHKGFPVES